MQSTNMLTSLGFRSACNFRRVQAMVFGAGVFALGIPLAFAATSQPIGGPGTLTLAGIGSAPFSSIQLNASPVDGSCATLSGGHGDSKSVRDWMASNRASGALASKPQATLEVQTPGGRPVTYRLSDVTVADYSERANPDGSHQYVNAVKLHCDSISAGL